MSCCKCGSCLTVLIVGLVLAVISAAAVLIVIFVINDAVVKIPERTMHSRARFYRVGCHPEANPTREKCVARGCDWSEAVSTGGPVCFFPNNPGSYELASKPVFDQTGGKVQLIRRSGTKSMFGDDVQRVHLDVTFISREIVRLKFYDPIRNRHEMPVEGEIEADQYDLVNKSYEVIVDEKDAFGVIIRRQPDGEEHMWAKPGHYELPIVFDSRHPSFVFSDQFLQLATRLPSWRVYGVGDGSDHLNQDINWQSWGLWSREHPSGQSVGVHPFIMAVDSDGKASGIFLRNSHAMEMVFQPQPAVVFRTNGGILDFFIFLGPDPESVVQQYTRIIGRPTLPPYWSLGIQYGREMMNETYLRDKIERMQRTLLPIDVIHLGPQVLQNYNGFTYDQVAFSQLPQLVERLRDVQGRKVVISTSAGIATDFSAKYLPYKEATNRSLLLHSVGGSKPLIGKLAQGQVVYPDYFKDIAVNFWEYISKDFYGQLKFDAIHLVLNSPANLVDGSTGGCSTSNKVNRPSYKPKSIWPQVPSRPLYHQTVCLDAKHSAGLHYSVHNLYGHQQAKVAYRGLVGAFPHRRPWVITSSHASGTGRYASHFITGTRDHWEDMRKSLIAILEMNMLGMPAVGSDICGSYGNSSTELCRRWIQLGAFYPIARIYKSGDDQDQDPLSMSDSIFTTALEAFNTRYTLLPYLYTLFYLASTDGSTVVRPLFHEFPFDNKTWSIENQFMWGSALLISPVLTPGWSLPPVYIPKGRWFDYHTEAEVILPYGVPSIPRSIGDQVSLHIRGGHVIPIHSKVNTTSYNTYPLHLIVALDEKNSSRGLLYVDNTDEIIKESFLPQGTQIRIRFENDVLRWQFVTSGYKNPAGIYVDCVRFLGVSREPLALKVDGKSWNRALTEYFFRSKSFYVKGLHFYLHDRYHAIQLQYGRI